ncbi:chromate transporter [Clostridium sp. DL1XJH146]
MDKLIELFLAFFKTGLFGFGGGQASVPLVQREIVENLKWMSIEEFTDSYALGNSLPGPITTKLAALIGYKTAGIVGLIVATMGLVIPSTVGIVVLSTIYYKFKDSDWLSGMMIAVRPVVVVLISGVVFSMAKTSFGSIHTYLLGIIAFTLVYFTNVHPVFMIIGAFIYGLIFI